MYIWIRRGYAGFVRCKNITEAKRRAAYWKLEGKGDGGALHPVIGLFVGSSKLPSQAVRVELYS